MSRRRDRSRNDTPTVGTPVGTAAVTSGRSRPRGRKRGILLLLIAALVAGGGVAANQLTPSRMLDAPAAEEIPAADAGTAYCPIVATEGETAQLEIASASAEEDSEVLLTRYVDGQPVPQDPVGIAAGQSLVLDIPAEEAGAPISLDWRGGPVVAQYRLDAPADVVGSGDQAVATCQTQPSDRWYLAGFDTNRGSTSTLHLFNPFSQDAVVSLQFGTAEGPVDLVIADEIQVPAGSVVVQDLAELRPETADLAVSVRAQVGRVVTQGHVVRGPAGEGLEAITGRALLPAVAVPSSELYLPEALSDEVTESWVTIYNPSERSAAVQVQVSTPLGDAGRLASELTVPAGGVARVDLAGLSALPRMGVVLRSVNGIGLIATRGSAVQDGARTGVSLAVATAVTDTRWTVVGGGEDAELVLFNPGEAIATATVTIGDTALAEDLEVPPNGLATLPLADVESAGAALVQSDEPLVAGVVNLSATDATAFWTAVGTSDARLRGASEAISAEREPSLSSAPVVSATATPTPLPEAAVPGGEGELDPTITPTTVPTPTVTPTPSPDATPRPTAPPPATVAPAPTPGAADTQAPDPGATAPEGEAPAEPAPQDGEIPESEGSLFG